MAAQLIDFPSGRPERGVSVALIGGALGGTMAPRAPSRPFAQARREYTLWEVARLTGLAHVSPKVMISTLRKLAEQNGMPLPKTPRVHKGRIVTGPRAIGRRSRWDALRFDDWLDDWTPPGGGAIGRAIAAPAVPAVSRAMRDGMAARAAELATSGRKRA